MATDPRIQDGDAPRSGEPNAFARVLGWVALAGTYLVVFGSPLSFTVAQGGGLLIVVAAGVRWVAGVGEPRRRWLGHHTWLLGGIGCWIAAMIVANLAAPADVVAEMRAHRPGDESEMWDGMRAMWPLLLAPAVLLAMPRTLLRRHLPWLLAALAAGTAVNAVYALVQGLSGSDPLSTIGVPLGVSRFDAFASRPRGFQQHALTFAGASTLAACMFAAVLATRAVGSRRARGIAAAGLVAALLAIAISQSFTYWIAAPIALALTCWLARPSARRAVLAWSVVAVILLIGSFAAGSVLMSSADRVGVEVQAPMGDEGETTALELRGAVWRRVAYWHDGAQVWMRHPVTGVGHADENLEAATRLNANRADGTDVALPPGNPHNLALWVLATTGLVGLWAFGMMLLGFATALWRARSRHPRIDDAETSTATDADSASGHRSGWTAGAAGGLIALLVAGVFEVTFFDGELMLLLMTLIGVAAAAGREAEA